MHDTVKYQGQWNLVNLSRDELVWSGVSCAEINYSPVYDMTLMLPNVPISVLVENEGCLCALFSFEGPETLFLPKARLRSVLGEAQFLPVVEESSKLLMWKNLL